MPHEREGSLGGLGEAPVPKKSRHALAVEHARMAVLEERRAEVIRAAEEAFTRKGYLATTMDDIATAAGMSKKTLYKLFAGKADLFREVVEASRPERGSIEASDPEQPAAQRLRQWMRGFEAFVFSDREIAIQRLIIGEGRVASDLPRIFTEVVASPGLLDLNEIVAALPLKPALRQMTAADVGELLVGIVFGTAHIRMLLSTAGRPSGLQTDARVDLAVTLCCD